MRTGEKRPFLGGLPSGLAGAGIALIGIVAAAQWSQAQHGSGAGEVETDCPEAESCVAEAIFTRVGDQNCDGNVDSADVDLITSGLYCDPCPDCEADDANLDERVSVADVVAVIELLAPPAPTPQPSVTRTPTRTVTPTITSIATSAPAAIDDTAATLIGEAIEIFVLANDSDPNGDLLNVTNFTQPPNGSVSFADNIATYTPSGAFSGTDGFTYTISDGTGGMASAIVAVVVHMLPPDPATAAPPAANGVATIVADSTSFLYTGQTAVQFGVAPDTIERVRAAVVRGKVMNRNGTPLAGVRITILNHAEFGFTASRADGMFDLAVNGGGPLTVNYEKPGFCPVQRQVSVRWQDYAMAPDVVMTALDPIVTPVTLGGTSVMQMAHGSTQSDANGTRTAMMMFMPGTSAGLVMPDGSTQPVSSLHVRATEFTVGPNGPAAMPALLPPTSAYTYCVEFSADEAMSAGAMAVVFSQPVINYVENFLDFPVGIAVPTGFYDRQKAAWVPSPNGRVIKILSITGGFANVDTDGDDIADSGLGITSEERQNLATLYVAGQTLWRVPLPHFSVVDENWGFVPDDATTPGQSGAGPNPDAMLDDPAICPGCLIEMENQVLGDSVGVVGTPYSLHYRSDREPGRIATRTFTLSGPSVPDSLRGIELHLSVGGRTFDQTFPPDPDQQFAFEWDREDAYGRTLLGGQSLRGSIDYIYPVNYAGSNTDPAFSVPGGAVLLENPGRQEFIISEPVRTFIGEGLTDARVLGLGGWTLNVHHFFDPVAGVVHFGNGGRRRADSLSRIINTVVSDPPNVNELSRAVAVGPDGSLYFTRFSRMFRLASDGTQTVVAGNGTNGPPSGDDGPATQATIFAEDIAVGPDGSLYFVQSGGVRRVGPDGIIRRVAGRYCTSSPCPDPGPDGGLATETDMFFPGSAQQVAVGPDGSLYLVNVFPGSPFQINRIRRVGPDGIVTTVAGSQACDLFGDPACGDGGPATEAQLFQVQSIAVAPDGSLYIADAHSIRRVRTDGIIERIAGPSFSNNFTGDGGPAINASLCTPFSFAFGSDGSLYFADSGNNRIRVIDAQGIINTFAGSGATSCGGGFNVGQQGDGGPARGAILGSPLNLAIDPEGVLYVSAGFPLRIRRIGSALPGISQTESSIASEDGSRLYVFDGSGRHLRTLDALTGATLREFGYDADGRLAQVTEKTGGVDNITTITHEGAGNPTVIIGPYGQQTTLDVDGNGFLASITNPASEQVRLTYNPGGLLMSKNDPRNKTTSFMFDPEGRLTRDAEPMGGTQDLARVSTGNASTVTRTTALDRTTTYETENLPGNIQRRTITAPDGTESESTESIDAATTVITSSDGTVSDTRLSGDPRFGLQSPVTASFSLQFPSSLQATTASTRSAVLANATNPLSLVSLTETNTVDGRTTTNTYTATTRTFVHTTPAGRTGTYTLDTLGRPVQGQFAGLNPVGVAYDDRGRLESLAVGSGAATRALSYAYNAQGFIETVTDPIDRTIDLSYDDAGRVIAKMLPDGRLIEYGYDAAGNLTSLTPPGRPAHTLSYSDRNELTSVTPPAVPGTGPTAFAYAADGALTDVSRGGVQTIAISYGAAGRPIERTLTTAGNPSTTDTLTYDVAGRVANLATGSGVGLTYTYDGALITGEAWTGPVAGSVTQIYDSSLRVTSQSINGANTVAFTFDNDSLLTGAGSFVIARNPQHGLPTSSTLGVLSSSLAYNGFGELTNYTASASGSPLYTYSFSRDALGRITQKVETIGGATDTHTYTYDTAGQLTDRSENGAEVESYTYDTNGNRTNATVDGITVNATYDAQDRLTQYGSMTFAHNAAGDLVSKTDGGEVTTYKYDALGNLLGVTLPDATAIAYVIDGRNRRVGKRVDGMLVQGFLYGDVLRPVAELDGSGAVVSRFVYAGRMVPAYLIKGGVSFQLISDQIGSVRLVVNSATGAVVQRMDYDTFGNVLVDTNPGFQPFGFAGGLYDTDTKFTRFGARDYDAETGRWTAKDPIGFGGGDANLYRYVRNDPVNLVDPLGKGILDDLLEGLAKVEGSILRDLQRLREIADTTLPDNPVAIQNALEETRVLNERVAKSENLSERLRQFIKTNKLNCGGAFGGVLQLASISDFINLGLEAFQTDQDFEDLLDAQAERERAGGANTRPGFLGPFPYVLDGVTDFSTF